MYQGLRALRTYGSALLIEDMENEYRRMHDDYSNSVRGAVPDYQPPQNIEVVGKILTFDQNKRRGTK
ncbi:MAG TPA: hypothetical protein VJA23_04570 [Candidatus Nanoarchaeia archaeon]|nr:hypothetical protein [Candidatus Nanoarchaeia archaeon]